MNYYNEIKNELINNEIYSKIKDYSKNKYDLETRYNVGKLLSEAGKHYGDGIIKQYSTQLINEIDKKYNTTNLKRMRQFYLLIEKGAPLEHQLSWSHYKILIPLKDISKINYYINQILDRNLSKRELEQVIKNNEYERLPEITKNKLINNVDIDKTNVIDYIKNPIRVKKNNYDLISEKVLQKLILEDIENFLEELGNGFTFIKSEYPIKLGNKYNYLDLLLYNIKYKCYVVIELKITELKKEHIGQIQLYMNYIDEKLKSTDENKTIGIIICKEDDEYVIKYCSNKRIISTKYSLV